MPDAPDRSWLTAHPIAHRGLHDGNRDIVENSLPAFALAVERGWPIELDVRLLADGSVAVFHDATLRRLLGEERPVRTLSRTDLPSLVLPGHGGTVPTLDETLELVAGRVPVVVECKPLRRGSARLAAAVAALLDDYTGEAAVLSFDPRLPGWFARHSPDRLRGLNMGAGIPLASRLLDGRRAGSYADPHFVGYPVERLPSPATERLRGGGVPVLAFTVRSGTQQRTARAHADGMFVEAWHREDPVQLP